MDACNMTKTMFRITHNTSVDREAVDAVVVGETLHGVVFQQIKFTSSFKCICKWVKFIIWPLENSIMPCIRLYANLS
jgi:hypothetical protein